MTSIPASLKGDVSKWLQALKPPEALTLSEWAGLHGRLEDGSRYRPFPYQIGILDAFTDPGVEQITVKKSARVGYSKIVQMYLGYIIHHAPCRVAVWQPTIDDAEDYSKTELSQLLQTPALDGIIDTTSRNSNNSIRYKAWPGGSLRIKGSNAAKEFARISLDKVILEEPDFYPPEAGLGGEQVEAAFKRAENSYERLLVVGGTPTIDGVSKVSALFGTSTQEHRYLPCPECGEMQALVFGDGSGPGLRWPKGEPEKAFYVCVNGCAIEERHKLAMDEAGEWRAHAPEHWPHRGFFVWSAYSQFPNASWGNIARDFLRVKDDPNKLRVFVNTTLGETFKVKGEAPPWRALYDRREDLPKDIVPRGGLVLTGFVDVQADRLEFFVWAWGRDRQCWPVAHEVLPGTPFTSPDSEPWSRLGGLVRGEWRHADGAMMRPVKIAVDAGYATNEVAAFCRRHSRALVIPTRGASSATSMPLSAPKAIDPVKTQAGRRSALKVWLIGTHLLKQELYGYLALERPTDAQPYPPGFVHLSTWCDEEFVKQLVAEEWNLKTHTWDKVRPRNEALDGWVGARAAAIAAGVDRMRPATWDALASDLIDGAVLQPTHGDHREENVQAKRDRERLKWEIEAPDNWI